MDLEIAGEAVLKGAGRAAGMGSAMSNRAYGPDCFVRTFVLRCQNRLLFASTVLRLGAYFGSNVLRFLQVIFQRRDGLLGKALDGRILA
jgi:hypothetical protein